MKILPDRRVSGRWLGLASDVLETVRQEIDIEGLGEFGGKGLVVGRIYFGKRAFSVRLSLKEERG